MVFMLSINRKKGGNVGHGPERKLTMTSIKKLYELLSMSNFEF